MQHEEYLFSCYVSQKKHSHLEQGEVMTSAFWSELSLLFWPLTAQGPVSTHETCLLRHFLTEPLFACTLWPTATYITSFPLLSGVWELGQGGEAQAKGCMYITRVRKTEHQSLCDHFTLPSPNLMQGSSFRVEKKAIIIFAA